MVMAVVVILPSVGPKSDIFRYVKNLKELEKWKRIIIADDLRIDTADLRSLV